jgi:hypothetical protein
MIHLRLLEKQEQTKPKTSRQREIVKIRVEIKIETKKKTYTKFCENINKINKLLAHMTKWKREKTQIKNFKSEMKKRR